MKDFSKELAWLLKDKYNGKETPEYLRDKARVLSGEPVDYVIGWTDFLSTRIFLNYRPLIPRTETEHWVEMLIEGIRPQPPKTILDIFCGSGAIGIALKKVFPSAELTCADLNTSALEQTRENLARNNIKGTTIRSNVFESISGTFDLITANPPYIPHGSTELAPSVKEYEPHDALYAKEDGLEFIRELLESGRQHLAEKGILAIEYDHPQKSAIEELGRELGWAMEFHKDQFGFWRSVFCK